MKKFCTIATTIPIIVANISILSIDLSNNSFPTAKKEEIAIVITQISQTRNVFVKLGKTTIIKNIIDAILYPYK